MRHKNIKHMIGMILIVIAVILFSSFISSLQGFSSSVSILPINATTSHDIYCEWIVYGEEEVNVTWYKNHVLFNESSSVSSPWYLPKEHTSKGEEWNCTVTIYNSSEVPTIEKDSDLIEILNAPPSTPYFINTSSVNIGTLENLNESETYYFTVITEDPDGDSLTYTITKITGDDYCSIPNSNNGTIKCSPTAEPDLSTNDRYLVSIVDGADGVLKYIEFNVTATNDAPNINLTDQVVVEETTLQYEVTIGDEENSTGFTYNTSSDTITLENISSGDETFIIQLENNDPAEFIQAENHTVIVKVCDPDSLCTIENFTLEIVPINQAPNITNYSYIPKTQGQLFNLYVNATDDNDGDNISFSIASDCTGSPWTIETLDGSVNGSAWINTTLTNNHIICRNITITATDNDGSYDNFTIILDITNTNDLPVLHDTSYYAGNTLPSINYNITNLTGYTNAEFVYLVNGTDNDSLTYESEILTFTDNSSLCSGSCPSLNMTSSGLISFTPNSSYIGTFSYKINLTDDSGSNDSIILNLEILNNTPPTFPAVEDYTAYEGVEFLLSINATDSQNDPYNFTSSLYPSIASFTMNGTGFINFTGVCSEIGNHTINISVEDDKGASTSDSFVINILNTQDSPVITAIPNRTSDHPIVEELPFSIDISDYASDADETCANAYDYINYSVNFLVGSALFTINETSGLVSFTPNTTSQGPYLVEFTVTDIALNTDTIKWNFTIVNKTNPPEITNITPYGTPLSSWTVFNWTTPIELGSYITKINISENFALPLGLNATDQDGNELFYNWTVDGVVESYDKNYTHTFNYTSSGYHNITVSVYDNVSGTLANKATFTWNVSVLNTNRAPTITGDLENVNLTEVAKVYQLYLTKFSDPDNDTLTYNHTAVNYSRITIDGVQVTFRPVSIGIQNVTFTACDPSGECNTSNIVTINVTAPPNITIETETVTEEVPAGRRTTIVPYTVVEQVEISKEAFLDIINPLPVIIYQNNTLRQTINIINKGNKTLRGITLGAQTNTSDAKLSFSNYYFASLASGETQMTDLIIQDYRLYNNYEIVIHANVTSPVYKDKAVIYVNALEKSRGNQSVTSTKITFAEDLLQSNPECLELNEFLKKALQLMEEEDYLEAAKVTDAVIQGCKYLVSQSKLKDESPTSRILTLSFEKIPYLGPALIGFFVIMMATIIITLKLKKSNEEAEE